MYFDNRVGGELTRVGEAFLRELRSVIRHPAMSD